MVRPTAINEAPRRGPSGRNLLRLVAQIEQSQAENDANDFEQAQAVLKIAAGERLAQLRLQAAEQGLITHLTEDFSTTNANPFTEKQINDARQAVWQAWGECLRTDPNRPDIDK